MMNRTWAAVLLATLTMTGTATAQQIAAPGATKPKPSEGPGEVSRNAPVNGVLTLFGN